MSQHLHSQGRQKHQVSLSISLDSVRILDHEVDEERRDIRGSVYICMPHTDLNKDGGHHLVFINNCVIYFLTHYRIVTVYLYNVYIIVQNI